MSIAHLNLVSHQESVKVAPEQTEKQTLHEQMCFIADRIVRYNLSDVAVHDARKLKKMRCGEYRLWIVTEFGSQFLPLSCKMSEWKNQELNDYYLSAVHVVIARFLTTHDGWQQAQNRILFSSAEFYLVGKGADVFSGTIEPMSFPDVVRFVFFGQSVEIPESLRHLF
jgi:hypothetical protein